MSSPAPAERASGFGALSGPSRPDAETEQKTRELRRMQRVATLNTWLSDMKTGQRLTFVRQPGERIKVVVGGVLKGTVPGDDFSRVFMSIWLGAAPPSAGLRAGLLGGPCD